MNTPHPGAGMNLQVSEAHSRHSVYSTRSG